MLGIMKLILNYLMFLIKIFEDGIPRVFIMDRKGRNINLQVTTLCEKQESYQHRIFLTTFKNLSMRLINNENA
jgi:DNA-binding protein